MEIYIGYRLNLRELCSLFPDELTYPEDDEEFDFFQTDLHLLEDQFLLCIYGDEIIKNGWVRNKSDDFYYLKNSRIIRFVKKLPEQEQQFLKDVNNEDCEGELYNKILLCTFLQLNSENDLYNSYYYIGLYNVSNKNSNMDITHNKNLGNMIQNYFKDIKLSENNYGTFIIYNIE